MKPDFNKKTIDTVAKRSGYKCSNPDCRIPTVGPNADPNKATILGEAAHIYGARSTSKRYRTRMTDAARAEITNAIWLCSNCHKLIDTDDAVYTSSVLFAWREQHEAYIRSQLGNATDRIHFKEQKAQLLQFANYPPIIRRIVLDKADGWEWRLTAELMRYLNAPLFRKLKDLREGLYTKHREEIKEEEIDKWIEMRLAEVEDIFNPVQNIFLHLHSSWGRPGESGDVDEIHHLVCLLRDYLQQIVSFEERVYFVHVPEEYEQLVKMLRNVVGSQIEKLRQVPDSLDEAVSLVDSEHEETVDEPLVVKKTIVFDIPEKWGKEFCREYRRIKKS